jgi:hypothetical protein
MPAAQRLLDVVLDMLSWYARDVVQTDGTSRCGRCHGLEGELEYAVTYERIGSLGTGQSVLDVRLQS